MSRLGLKRDAGRRGRCLADTDLMISRPLGSLPISGAYLPMKPSSGLPGESVLLAAGILRRRL